MEKKVAIIDLGTNTFHILIGLIKDKKITTLFKEKRPVKIGKGGISEGLINAAAQQRALDALTAFKDTIEAYQVDAVHAIATSAIRNAKNGLELVAKIKEVTGIEVRVISGIEEAEYIHYGVSKALTIGPATSLIMDIGGGSVEFIICKQDEILWKESFEIGAQRLVDLFHQHDPMQTTDINRLYEFLDTKLSSLKEHITIHSPSVLIGCSGTFDTLSDIYRSRQQIEKNMELTELPFSLPSYFDIHQELISKNREERLQIPGMIELRVEMIVVASCLVHYIIDRYDLKKMRISSYALKEGIMNKVFDSFQESVKNFL